MESAPIRYCRDCHAVGLLHCSDPVNCGGMRLIMITTIVTYKRTDPIGPNASKYGTLRLEGTVSASQIKRAVAEAQGAGPINIRVTDGDETLSSFTLD